MSEHALISASAAERDTICPISVLGDAEDTTSAAAAEGTLGHKIGEDVLRGLPWPAIGSKHTVEGHTFTIEESFLTDVYAYVKYVQSINWVRGFNVEGRVNYSRSLGVPYNLAFGTSDCWGFSQDVHGQILEVLDLKMGRKPVNPERNKQGVRYAGGVLDGLFPLIVLPRTHRVRITIYQPRLSHTPFSWLTTVGTVQDMLKDMQPAAAAAVAYHNGTATQETWAQFPEIAGAHCHYCRRKPDCGEIKRYKAKVLAAQGKPVAWDEQLYRMADVFKQLFTEMEDMATAKAMAGTPLPGTKLVAGKNGNPKLLVPYDQVREIAKGLGMESSVVETKEVWETPAKIRDAFIRVGMPRPDVLKIVASPPGAPKLALADDPRPAIIKGADISAFSAIQR